MRRFLLLALPFVACTATPPPAEDVFAESRFIDDVNGDDVARSL